jgi:hypothetical protein
MGGRNWRAVPRPCSRDEWLNTLASLQLLMCMQVSRAWRDAASRPALWQEIRWPPHISLNPARLKESVARAIASPHLARSKDVMCRGDGSCGEPTCGGVRVLDISIDMEEWMDSAKCSSDLPDILSLDDAIAELRGSLSSQFIAGNCAEMLELFCRLLQRQRCAAK